MTAPGVVRSGTIGFVFLTGALVVPRFVAAAFFGLSAPRVVGASLVIALSSIRARVVFVWVVFELAVGSAAVISAMICALCGFVLSVGWRAFVGFVAGLMLQVLEDVLALAREVAQFH